MTRPADLTRWNRSGLRRFVYVAGSAPSFLESVRAALAARFGDRWPALPPSPTLDLPTELDVERSQHRRNQRLVEQYHAEARGDLAWEIARAFSRATHVLAAHVEVHANEAFLRTATEWESMRRLVQLIDYRPAAATSATTELVILGKPGKRDVLPRGFQVKYAPPEGGPQVIFETLEDLELDADLNELRPNGWDRSPAATAPPDVQPSLPLSKLAREPVQIIEGVGAARAHELDRLRPPSPGGFRVADLLSLDPASAPGVDISRTWLYELQAKARVVVEFEVPPGFDAVAEWTLERILATSSEALSLATARPLLESAALREQIKLLEACLDHPVFRQTPLSDLLPETAGTVPVPNSVRSEFCVPGKPKVKPGQVAMVFHAEDQRGEAAIVLRVEQESEVTPGQCPKIHLKPSPVQYTFGTWPKSASRLLVTPRWLRKCWLNGDHVVRTEKPHGLRQDAFVAFRSGTTWRFAEVIEADERNLRLRLVGALPTPGTKLYQALPLEGPNVPADLEFGLVGGLLPQQAFLESKVPTPLANPSAGGLFVEPPPKPPTLPALPLLPPGALSFGSFLFPSPFLPVELVKAAVEMLLSIGAMVIPSTGKPVFKFPSVPIPELATKLLALIPEELWAPAWPRTTNRKGELERLLTPPPGATESVLFKVFTEALSQSLAVHGPLLGIAKNPPFKAIVSEAAPQYVCDGSPQKLAEGAWVVAEFKDGLRALEVKVVLPQDGGGGPESFGVLFEGLFGNEGELVRIYADFRGELLAERGTQNEDPVSPDTLELSPVPDGLKRGRRLLLESAAGVPAPVLVTVTEVGPNGVKFEPPATGFSKGELIVRGNVVASGHGASKPEKRLSTGTEATRFKSVVLEVENVASLDDPTFPRGVRADVDVVVEGLRYKQVASLHASGPTDPHYLAEATEDGFLRLVFGDGSRGRRVPPGTNNVRVRYRVGAGRSGNLAAGSLVRPVNPHWLVGSVEQPLASTRGEELESVARIRENAPATLLALERSVSISDFENLAAQRNDVWQAKAFHEPDGSGYLDRVRVVVVPAGGGALDVSSARAIAAFLNEHAVPTVSVVVENFQSKLVRLEVTIRVDEAKYDASAVVERVRATLTDALSLEHRAIQQTLYLSDVYYLVESVEGVSDSECAFGDSAVRDGSFRSGTDPRVDPDNDRQVVYFGGNADDLLIRSESYRP